MALEESPACREGSPAKHPPTPSPATPLGALGSWVLEGHPPPVRCQAGEPRPWEARLYLKVFHGNNR